MRKLFFGILPLLLLAIPVGWFLSGGGSLPFGESILVGDRPPIEEIAIQRVRMEENLISIDIVNDGPDPVTISQVLVNGSYWAFTVEDGATLGRLSRRTVLIEYPWNTGDDQHITMVTSTGVTFPLTIPAAVESPRPDRHFAGILALIGVLIGVVPVFLGLIWFPFVRMVRDSWYRFFMAVTVGLLIFLGVDTMQEGLELSHSVPESLNGVGVLLLGFAISFMVLFGISRNGAGRDYADPATRARTIVFAAAFGIGVHNLGEGLAVGSAFAVGNVSLGATLIVGFMIHNITEGLPLIAPVARGKAPVGFLVRMGFLAGAPAIIGTIIGGYAFSPVWGVFFLGIGGGAIFQVVIEIIAYMNRKVKDSLFTPHGVGGVLAGIAVMYGTGLIIGG